MYMLSFQHIVGPQLVESRLVVCRRRRWERKARVEKGWAVARVGCLMFALRVRVSTPAAEHHSRLDAAGFSLN